MQVNVEALGQLERRLSISIPLTEIDAEVANRLKRVARSARIQGFRPGKAPLKIVEQHYGGQVREEVLGDTVQKRFADAVEQSNLRVVGYPSFEPAAADVPDTFSFAAVFEIYPDIQLGDVSTQVVEVPVIEVAEEHVDKTLDILRQQRQTFEPADRGAQLDDRVTIDYAGTIDGVAFDGGTAQGYPAQLGKGHLLEAFETHLIGMKAGESKTFEVTFPDDYHGKEVAGKTASFAVTVQAVDAPKLPELDANFARSIGIEDGDLDKMRAEVRKNVEREVAQRVKGRRKENVMNAVLAVTPIEVPKALVQAEQQRLAEQARQDLAQRGYPVDRMPFPDDAFTEQAKRRVQLGLILGEVVRQNDLSAKPEQVRAVVENFAESYEHPEEVVKWYYASQERLQGAEALAIEDNVVQWVLDRAKVENKPLAFDELMGANA